MGDPITLTDGVDGGVGIAMHTGDDSLRTRVNEALAEIMADGTYAEMAAVYFDFDITPPGARREPDAPLSQGASDVGGTECFTATRQ